MSIIKQDQRRLDNIANMYHKTSGEMREMWRKKWYELVNGRVATVSKVCMVCVQSRWIFYMDFVLI